MKANVWATHNLRVVYKYNTAKCLKHVQHFVTISYYFTYICGLDDKLGAKTVFKNVLIIDCMQFYYFMVENVIIKQATVNILVTFHILLR